MKNYIVDGGILIDTPFFKFENAICGYGDITHLEGDLLPTNQVLPSGGPYLLIDDENLQSMFAIYHAKDWISSGYCWAPMFNKTYDDDYQEFTCHIADARLLMGISVSQVDEHAQALLSRQAMLTILTALDTFVADTILTRIVNDEQTFYDFANSIDKPDKIKELISLGNYGQAEKEVIEYVLTASYCNKDRIKNSYKHLFGISVHVDGGLSNLFRERHRIAHRGGRKKDGAYVHYTQEQIDNAILIVDGFVKTVLESIKTNA